MLDKEMSVLHLSKKWRKWRKLSWFNQLSGWLNWTLFEHNGARIWKRKWSLTSFMYSLLWAGSSEFGSYRLYVQRRLRRACASVQSCAVSPEPPLLAHTGNESRGTFRQKARSLAPLNGWAWVKICHDGMLEDTNSLDVAHMRALV